MQIDLIVRGMCRLRPGLAGISEHIRVVSVIDRYLEHARIFYFDNNGKPEYLLASADWMRRNFDHRVEIAFPVLDEQHQAKLKNILEVQLADNFKGWLVRHDCSSVRLRCENVPPLRSQERLYEVMRPEPGGPAIRPPARFE